MRYYTLTRGDIGMHCVAAFERIWPVSDFIGRILSDDVGKRVYLRGDTLQVENDAQRAARMEQPCQALHNHNPADYDTEMAAPQCQCPTGCGMPAVMHLFRVTAYVHETPIHERLPSVFCELCGDKALESGTFCAGDDLLEPHHGPDCAKRMLADLEEGGQS